jgi:Family of unknown function (DUF5906)/NrS-1  polymerase HBD domain
MLNRIPVNMQAVPSGLERYRQFINWRLTPDGSKLPCDIHGNIINAHDPVWWLSAEEAALSPHPLAFVFCDRDPFWFIDLDDAWNGSQWSTLAQWCLTYFAGCAVEISHSGTGLHLFGAGSYALPADHGCKNIKLGVELYTRGRFCALTGTQKAGNAWLDFGERLAGFVVSAALTPRETVPVEDDEQDGPDPRYTGPADDDALIALMLNSQGSVKSMFGANCHVRDLWQANRPALEAVFRPGSKRDDGLLFDWSSADASLMSHLAFWTGHDRARMARLFARSKLYRASKYEGKGAYRLPLVLKQGLRNTGVYDRPAPGLAVPPVVPGAVGASLAATGERGGRSTMDLAKQVEHFKGCVYVQAAHAVMVPDGRLLRPAVFNASYGGFSFQMQYDGGRPTHEAFTAFTENRMMRFPSAVDTCFRPDRAPAEMITGRVNTWVPPVIDEAPGDISPFLNHVAKLIPDPTDRRILFTYMQSLARNPGCKFQWAPVIQGTEGNGKSLIIRVLVHAVSREYSHLPKASQLTEKYNSWLEGRLFIGVEEIKVADRREVLEDLKDSVTNDWIEIRRMQQDKKMTNNYTNWIFCSNYKDAIPVNADQRRYAIFFTAQQAVADLIREGMTDAYFVELYRWLREGGGYQAVAHWLRNAPIEAPEYDPAGVCQRAPATTSRVEAISVSLGRVEQTIMDAIENDEAGFRDGWISTGAVTQYLTKRGVRDVSSRKMGDILKSIGFEHRFKSSAKIIEENGNRSHVWRKQTILGGSQMDFMIAQGYHSTLRGGF